MTEHIKTTAEKSPNFGTAFKGIVSTDWAITKDAYRQMLAIAARINPEKGVAVADGKRLEYTRSVTVRDGVAIIPIIGPIFRYANFFTYYCGGVTVQDLAKDLTAAIENPNIYSILFEVNSPGGEVGGINELGKMIFAARKKIPMTAYVDVYNCSAAYWLSSACGDIVADETAQIGSIGVCTAYLDDRKNLEMNGLEEIEIISSQSPYKNMPPTSDEGKARIQNRIDALAQIFVDTVAKHRGVSAKTVLANFGKGDVLLGQEAVEAQMIDRIGDFETTLAELANAHTPENIRMLGDTRATLNPATGVAFLSEAQPGEETKISEEIMATENQEAAAAIPAAAPAAAQKENQPATQIEGGFRHAAFEELQAQFTASQKANSELAEQLEASNKLTVEANAAAAQTKLTAEFNDIAKDFAGDKDAKVALMTSMSAQFGKDSAELAGYIADQKVTAAQIAESDLFKEQGKTVASTEGTDAYAEMEKLAETRAAEKHITVAQAMTEVAGENPELVKRYERGE